MRFADLLITLGAVLLLVGVILKLVPGLFSWFGNLPGDIRIEDDSSFVFIPLTSMIVVSVVLTVVVNVLSRLLGD